MISTRSPTSNGCLTNRKMHDPRNSWAVTEKTNERDSSVVPVVVNVVTKLGLKNATKNQALAIAPNCKDRFDGGNLDSCCRRETYQRQRS